MSASSRERVLAAYRSIDELDRPEIWIHLRPLVEALAAAADIDRRVETGESLPLAGTVFAVKDNIDVAGMPTTAACAPFSHLPTVSSPSVARLLDAGAVVLGKTNLDQFATGLVGTRSPFGAVRSALLPDRVSGGSSSGSAVAVALGIADFALGTDTAGSGRVPASFNGIVGIKPTIGLVPTEGVTPACRSYDCVTVFARSLAAAQLPLHLITGPSPTDHRSRTWPAQTKLAAPPHPVVAIPRDDDLTPLSAAARRAFANVAAALEAAGAELVTIDITPFLDSARLLYDGALVAERYEAFGAFLEANPDAADPSVLSIIRRARDVRGADVVRDQNSVLEFRLRAERTLSGADALLLPTTTHHPTFDEVAADPIGVNSRLGTYSNFVNLLDMCAVSVPAGEADGGPFGVTVIARSFQDQIALDIAALVVGETALDAYPAIGIPVVVFGAHMRGMPLNAQLVEIGARFVREVTTAPRYRMYALPGIPARPGVIAAADGQQGVGIGGEEWLLPPAGMGVFITMIPRPMTLGPVELSDGRTVTGFGCSEPRGADVSEFGDWRSYLADAG
ncbi:allophanate hydrolase [Gryllotalpicola sp.]|uniref:allophanate hydrolase n=1 Tax=Gryllotalpicola sp. TaxID=1932787 RepID=UPI00260A2562|nr:allophanate hydrolase [Gryllotalpicola sp.]